MSDSNSPPSSAPRGRLEQLAHFRGASIQVAAARKSEGRVVVQPNKAACGGFRRYGSIPSASRPNLYQNTTVLDEAVVEGITQTHTRLRLRTLL